MMGTVVDADQFRDSLATRAIVLADLPPGACRDLAAKANHPFDPQDATLRTEAEFDALFDLVRGEPNATRLITTYQAASIGRQEFFDRPMYTVAITGWPADKTLPDEPITATGAARLALWRCEPDDQHPIPAPGQAGVLFASSTFSLYNSGNRTKYAPKRSWKINVKPSVDDDHIVGMGRLNLKSMYNDPSQMREALAWELFRHAGVPASRHSYARLGLNGEYKGLFSMIEQVDTAFLRQRFGANHHGNLYKGYCGDVGCASLEHRTGAGGDDCGRQYYTPGSQDLTYRLKTNEDDAGANTYDDLAHLIRVINGVGLPGGDHRFDTDAFRDSVDHTLNARAFLRWAGVNLLLGSWDNYFATPANYYLYNSGRRGAAKQFMTDPYFTFLPWDYDNCLGLDYFTTRWQDTDLLDWAANTAGYHQHRGTSRIPLVQNLLANHDFAQYYLDHLDHLLDTVFTPAAFDARIGIPHGPGLWQRVATSAYHEADHPHTPPATGRQYTNDEVYQAGHDQRELRHGDTFALGIHHYVLMRYDHARKQLANLRRDYPAGASGATFPTTTDQLPPPP